MFTFFTTSEANKVLPDIIKKYEYSLAKQNQVKKLEKQLQMNTGSFQDFITLKQQFNSAITKFYESIEILENAGAVVKSIDQGLLDLPSKHFDQEIWLCWKYGETEIKFWHEKDSGFMGRKPIKIDDESLV